MLYNIKTGYRGIAMQPQSDIVYIVCKAADIIAKCGEWCFTDGHAKTAITGFYNDLKDIGEVDWDIVNERYWNNTDEDFDRMRRKQAEFLVKDVVPVSCIAGIGVYDEEKRILVQEILDRLELTIPVKVSPKLYF